MPRGCGAVRGWPEATPARPGWRGARCEWSQHASKRAVVPDAHAARPEHFGMAAVEAMAKTARGEAGERLEAGVALRS